MNAIFQAIANKINEMDADVVTFMLYLSLITIAFFVSSIFH
jgi:hypothetical protein